MSEQDQFLKDLEQENKGPDILEAPLEPEKDKEEIPEIKQDDEEKLANRRERRLAARLQAERESSIALAARLEAITEAQKFRQESNTSDHFKGVERIYGTNSPEAIEATELLKKALLDAKEAAKKEALEAFQEERQREAVAVQKEEQHLDSMLEELEDEYGVDLTSDGSEAVRKGFFKYLEKLSPKDNDGNIIAYADPHAVWGEFQSKFKKSDNRAKDLSSRSMVQSGASKDTKLSDDVNERFLKENGII